MRLPAVGLVEREAAILRDFAIEISNEMDTCQKEGRVTDRALELLTHYHSTEGKQALYDELFKGEDA